MKINMEKLNEGNPSKSNPSDYLLRASDVVKYYTSVYNNIKEGKANALKSIKQDGSEWRLKLQCAKYSHPLYMTKDSEGNITKYPSASFGSKQEALDFFKDWLSDFRNGEKGIVDAVNEGYREYCKAKKLTQSLPDVFKEAV